MLLRTFSSLLLAPALALSLSSVAVAQAPAAQAAGSTQKTWKIDPTHSELTFQIRHMVSRVRGQFGEWNGTIVADPKSLANGSVDVQIKTASIDTNNERRDTHLRTDDFFSAETHPAITFKSTRVESQGENIKVHGNLTLRGVTKPVVLEGQFLGVTKDGQGKQRIGFEAETTINRHDFGVSWNRALEVGMTLGDEVKISMVVAAIEQAPAATQP